MNGATFASMEWTWLHAPGSLWSALLMLCLLGGLLVFFTRCYQSESALAGRPGRRRVLIALRILTVLTLAMVLLGPSRTPVSERTVLPRLLVLLDRSQSMSIADAGAQNDRLRLEVLREKLLEPQFFETLARHYQVQTAAFADDIHTLDDPASATVLNEALIPEGRSTNMASAISDLAEQSAGAVTAGAVVLSDFRSNTGSDPLNAARQLSAPIITIGLGRDIAPRNVVLRRIEAPNTVFPGAPFEVLVEIESFGFEGEEAALTIRDGADEMQEIAVGLQEGRQTRRLEITLDESGLHNLAARVAPLAGESSDEDNTAIAPVRVVDRKTRILLVAGQPSWDYRAVRRLLHRDPTIDLSTWQQSATSDPGQDGNTLLENFPADDASLSDYDAILLFDPDLGKIETAWWTQLKAHVEETGAGLLYRAGAAFTPTNLRGGALPGALSALLPVEADPDAAVDLLRIQNYDRPWNVKVPPLSTGHPLMRPGDGIVEEWTRLPSLYWWYAAARPKAGAETLLTREDDPEMELVVSGRAGRGSILFIATGEFWRWRSRARGHYEAFWLRVARQLASGRQASGTDRLETDLRSYTPGQKVLFSARLFDPSGAPLERESVPLEITDAGEEIIDTVRLQADPERNGHYKGQWIAGRPDNYLARVQGQKEDQDVSTHFRVEPPTAEFQDVTLNTPLLEAMARESRGTTMSLEALTAESIIDALPDRRQIVTLRGRPHPLCDSPWLLVWITLLLGTEWFLRRRWSMA